MCITAHRVYTAEKRDILLIFDYNDASLEKPQQQITVLQSGVLMLLCSASLTAPWIHITFLGAAVYSWVIKGQPLRGSWESLFSLLEESLKFTQHFSLPVGLSGSLREKALQV